MKNQLFHILFILILAMSASAQVNVSLSLRPPYSAYIKDYYHLENKAIIILTNGSRTPVEVKLGGSISNELRGVYIRTEPGYRPAMPIRLPAGATVTLTANTDAMNFFDQGNVSTNANDAMIANIIRTGMLPEGNYRICINAYDYQTGRQLSNNETGCTGFDISQADPPLITFPQQNYVYPAGQKNLNFSWTPPLGNLAGAIIEYDHIVVRVQPGQNPNDAIAAARDFRAGNPVLNKRSGLSQSYITQPADLPFDPGNYAMQVVARDRNQKILLNNEGKSEIVQFEVADPLTPTTAQQLHYTADNDLPQYYTAPNVKGTLKYYWPTRSSGNGPLTLTDFGSYENSPLKGVSVKLILTWQVQDPAGSTLLLPGGIVPPFVRDDDNSENPDRVIKLATTSTNAQGQFAFNVPEAEQLNFNWQQASVRLLTGSMSQADINTPVPDVATISGTMRRVLMLVVDNVYYCQPAQFKNSIPANQDLGVFYSRVKTVDIKINVQDHETHAAKSAMDVYLMRKVNARPQAVPPDEMSPGDFSQNERRVINGVNYEVLAKGETSIAGETLFQDAVFFNSYGLYNGSPNDRYYVYGEAGESNFSLKPVVPRPVEFKFKHKITDPYDSEELEAYQDLQYGPYFSFAFDAAAGPFSYKKPQEFYAILETENARPRLEATVRNAGAGVSNNSSNRAEAGVSYRIYRISHSGMMKVRGSNAGQWGGGYSSMGENGIVMLDNVLTNDEFKLEKAGITGADGKIIAKDLNVQYNSLVNPPVQIGYYRFLQLEKAGFNTRVLRAKPAATNSDVSGDMAFLSFGERYDMKNIDLQPSGSVFFRFKNERGEPVDARAYYTDPATGQNGISIQSQRRETNDNHGYESIAGPMMVPTGQRRIVVVPTNPNNSDLYSTDTVLVNVPEGDQATLNIVVKYKLHRIHVKVKNSLGNPLPGARVELMYLENGAAIMYNDISSPYIHEGSQSAIDQQIKPGNTTVQQIDPEEPLTAFQGTSAKFRVDSTTLGPYEKITNNSGGADFAFRNGGSEYTFRISGPDGTVSFVTIHREVTNFAGKIWQKEEVDLAIGRTVKGTVKIGTVPVANANVYVINSSPVLLAKTDSMGRYELRGVPTDTDLRFSASKQGYQGMEYDETEPDQQSAYGLASYTNESVSVQLQGSPAFTELLQTIIHFKLRIYEGLDLSKLLGFPMEVTSLKEIDAGMRRNAGIGGGTAAGDGRSAEAAGVAVEIAGWVNVSDSLNTLFKMTETTAGNQSLKSIRFEKTLVVADDLKNDSLKPYCRPQELPMRTAVNEQHISVYNFYSGRMFDQAGIALNKSGAGSTSQGAVQSKVTIDLTSFTSGGLGLANGELFTLVDQVNNNSTLFPVFTSSGLSIVNADDGIGIGNTAGEALHYNLYGFDAIAAAGSSKVYADSMVLDTRIQTNLQYVPQPNLNLHIGGVTINAERMLENMEKDLTDKRSQIGSFTLNWNHVRMTQAGFSLDGSLNAAGMEMPFNHALLYPTQFQIGDGSLDAGNVNMLGHIDVQVNAGASFGYETAREAWVVAIFDPNRSFANPSAAFSTAQLQGFAPNSSIPIAAIHLYSNDTREISLYPDGNYNYRLFDIANFYIDNILPSQQLLKMPGSLDVGIPGFGLYYTAVQYEDAGTALSGLTLEQFAMAPVRVNGIVMGFNPGNYMEAGNSNSISFSPGKLEIKGNVSDEQPDVFKNIRTTLTKTTQLTELVIDEPEGALQSMALGGSNTNSRMVLSNIAGRMWVENNTWKNLYIEGDMPEDKGFTAEGKHMRFEVKGYLEVNDQAVGLKNIDTPFGQIKMIYDIQNHRLSGDLSVNASIAGGASFSGRAEMVIDRKGYYFMAGLGVSLPSPQIQGNAFTLIGDYSERTIEMDALLAQYSVFIKKSVEVSNPMLANSIMSMLASNPQAALAQIKASVGNDYLPGAYTLLFGEGRFNGFYFNAGASIPLPIIPNFELDLSPIANFKMGLNGGIDVRFGANFGAVNSYSAGFNVFLDAAVGVSVSGGLFCVSGRIGVLVYTGLDGVYRSDGTYTIQGDIGITLGGYMRVGGGVCSIPCDDAFCLNVEAEGTLGFRLVGTITESDEDFRIEGGVNKVTNTVNEPPKEPAATNEN